MVNDLLDSGKLSLVEAFGSSLLKAGKRHNNLVLLHADNLAQLELEQFIKVFSDRHFNFGFGESNMVSASMGFVVRGKLPVLTGYTNFLVVKSFEQIRNSICVPNLNVKIISLGSGFSFPHDGPGYQIFEDIALMKLLPNMKIIVPGDHFEVMAACEAMLMDYGPTYMRLNNLPVGCFHSKGYKFKFEKIDVVREGDGKVVIFSAGVMMSKCIEVSNFLKERGVGVTLVNLPSVKPFDNEGVLGLLKKSKVCFTVEDHNVVGGIGDSVAEVMIENALPVKLKKMGMNDCFGESGKAEDLYRKFGLDTHSLTERIWKILEEEDLTA